MPESHNPLPDQMYLRECFSYDPQTGDLSWRDRPIRHFSSLRAHRGWINRISRVPNRVAGSLHHMGYINVKLDGKIYLAHRLIFKIMTGTEPNVIDHKDRNKSNNAWVNLRDGTTQDNTRNRKARTGIRSGFKGVYFHRGIIEERICIDGRDNNLGTFPTVELAHAAYCAAARKHFGEFWSPG